MCFEGWKNGFGDIIEDEIGNITTGGIVAGVKDIEAGVIVGNKHETAAVVARVTELGVEVGDFAAGGMDVAGDFPRSANGVGEAGGVANWFHPLSGLVSWEYGGIEDANAKFGEVVDRRKEATGRDGNTAIQAEAGDEFPRNNRASKFGFAGWNGGVGRSHTKGFENGFTIDGSHGFARNIRDCDPKQQETVVGVSRSSPWKECGRLRAFVHDKIIGGTINAFGVEVFEIPVWSQVADVY